MDKEKMLKNIEKWITALDGATGRLLVTATSGNAEVNQALGMVTEVSIELGELAEEIEYGDENGN